MVFTAASKTYADAGSYTIKITATATLSDGSTAISSTTFIMILTVPVCSEYPLPITLSVVTPAKNQSYVVGSGLTSYTIAEFSQDSVCCNSSDIVYSMVVSTSGQGKTSIISFNSKTRIVSW
jgi:hypothetical protein